MILKRVYEITQGPQSDPHNEQVQNNIVYNRMENNKSLSNDKKQKTNTHIQFQVTGSVKHWIEGGKVEPNKKRLRFENELK